MRFLVDVSSDARLARHLERRGFDAARLDWNDPQDVTDEAIRTIVLAEARVIPTDDRDVEELAVRLGLPHAGIISVRLESVDIAPRITGLEAVLAE